MKPDTVAAQEVRLQKVIAQAGVTSEPEITFYRQLDLGDSFG